MVFSHGFENRKKKPDQKHSAQILASLDAIYTLDHLQRPSTTAGGRGSAPKKRKRAGPKGIGAGTGYGSGAGVGTYAYGGPASAVASSGTGYAYEDDEAFDDYDSEMDYGYGLSDGDDFGGGLLDSEGEEFNPDLYKDESAFYEAMEAKVKVAKKNKGKAPAATATTAAAKKAAAQKAKANGRGNEVRVEQMPGRAEDRTARN